MFSIFTIEEPLKHLTSFLPFSLGNHGNHIARLRASRSSTSDNGCTMAAGTPAAAALPFVIRFSSESFKPDGASRIRANCNVSRIEIKGAG